jgi:DNA-directed RNA polymerase specialized sigma24 family protein
LLAVLRDHPAAEDCAQETFVRAYRSWKDWKPDAPAEAWLHRIALEIRTWLRGK